MTTAALMLAAGGSRRFGAQDKLMADLDGIPLVLHAARAVAAIAPRLAVVRSGAVGAVLAEAGFATLIVPEGPQSDSLRAGVARLQAQGVTRILLTLGDMPFLTAGDVARLLAMPHHHPACAWHMGAPIPPAIFPAAWFARLVRLDGDRGAGSLLRDLPLQQRVVLPPEHLRDIDTRHDLCAAGHG